MNRAGLASCVLVIVAGIGQHANPVQAGCSHDPSACIPLQDTATLTCVPVGYNLLASPPTVIVECWLTPGSDMEIEHVNIDLACMPTGGTAGGVSIVNAFADTAHVDPPFVGMPTALTGAVLNRCWVWVMPPILAPSLGFVQGGQTYYVATFVFEVADCTAGDFEITIENFSDPPDHLDGTCVINVNDCSLDLDVQMATMSISLPAAGTCCTSAGCQADEFDAACCQALFPGAKFHESRTCADANPCPNCSLAEQLELPCCIVYGDVFPSPPNGVDQRG